MTLLALRHGQASFGSADYDQLSEIGVTQAARFGRWLAHSTPRVDAVVCGSMRRHRQTLEAMLAQHPDGARLPAAQIDPDLDEFDHRSVMHAFANATPEHPDVRAVAAGDLRPRVVFGLLRAALAQWAQGRIEVAESWPAFQARTRRAFARLNRFDAGACVLLISSGGVISQLAQLALDTSDLRALELNLSLRNCGLSEFHRLDDGLRLGSWNGVPHLADAPELWTHF